MGVLLQRRDYERILTLVRSLDPAEGPRDIREAITLSLMEMFSAHGGIFFLGDPDSGRLTLASTVLVNVDSNYYDQYVRHYWRLDPVYDAVSNGGTRAFRFSDTRPSSRCPKNEFYNDFLRPQGIGAELVLCFLFGNKLSASISLFRSTHDPDFAYQDVRKASVVSSHMSAIFHNATLLSQLHEEKARFQSMYESMEEGIIVLDNQLKVIFCNSTALKMSHLWSPKGPHWNHCEGNESLVVPDKVLEDCLALKTGFEVGGSMVDLVGRPIAYVYVNETDYFRADSKIFTNPFESMSKAYILITIRGPSKIAAHSEGSIKKEYDLTKRELEVIHYVSQGLTNQQTADRLFVSLFTVITHLKNIYRKVGVRNRTELVFRLQDAPDRRKSLQKEKHSL
jgi:DNA-binding CsgD family transcriptional regulator/PAS domain-containing protein